MTGYDYAAVYRDARERIVDLVRGTSPGERAVTVPGCPEWTVADTVAHLAAGASGVVSGHLDRVPSGTETAEQVAARRGLALNEVLDEWHRSGAEVQDGVTARRIPLNIVHDAVTHEADIRGALRAGRPPEQAWQASLAHLSRGFEGWLGRNGELTVHAGRQRFTAGSGQPRAAVEVEPYELWRALFGRRSRDQMRGWAWTGDPEPHVYAIPMFGPTSAPLTEPDPAGR